MTTNLGRDEMTPLSVPVGYRFHPTEEELVNYYLKKKIHGGNVSEIDQIIPFIDLCKHEPAELPGLLGTEAEDDDMEWFFFTRNAYKYNKSSRSNRSTSKGFWKITGKEREIKARRSKAVIGKKRTLTFYQGRGEAKKKKTGWVIHEYYLPRNDVVSCSKQEKGDIVLCRLKNKSDRKDSTGDDEMNLEGNGEPQPLDDWGSSAVCSPASQELGAVLQTNRTNGDKQSPFGDGESCLRDRNEVATCDEDESVYDVYPQLRDPPEENLDSFLCPPQPQDYCPPIVQSPIYMEPVDVTHPQQSQNYQSSVILQPPIYTKQGNLPDANLYYGECNNWQPESNKAFSTDKMDIHENFMSYIENQAPDYGSLEVPHPHTEVNLKSAVYPFQQQDSTLMYTEFGEWSWSGF